MKVIPQVRIEIKPSKMLEGEVGVFAARALKKNSLVAHSEQFKHTTFFPWSTFKTLDTVTKKKVYGYCSGDEKGFYAPPDLNYISIAWHLNHCCNPNVGFDKDFNFVAMRNIKKGEELSWDYTYDESNPLFKMKCTCGSKNCRKVITGNDWKTLMHDPLAWEYFSEGLRKFATKMKRESHT